MNRIQYKITIDKIVSKDKNNLKKVKVKLFRPI
jgi:hypothetical protein